MRFIKDGPLIPSELLIAHDQGRVVFFCGAGVSSARAILPNFCELAEKTCDILNVSDSNPVRKLIINRPKFEHKIGMNGLISMDKVFGLLERDFDSYSIANAVATSLKPTTDDINLSAHRIMLDLATTQEKRVQLVTTNFDRLFTNCRPTLKSWVAPDLPKISHQSELNGVVYLHGRVTEKYDGAEKEFVLSSSQFGRAYLADAWATDFFKAILSKYLIVFVGYSADDPPISYLLEALNYSYDMPKRIYAFQPGENEGSLASWKQKGVTPILYVYKDGQHIELWNTLEAWVERARNTNNWYAGVIEKARNGPRNLEPYERGQVAHIISTTEGARKLAESMPPPPAEWLCVFDSICRYAGTIRSSKRFEEVNKIVDPFKYYHLDSDKRMPQMNANDTFNWLENNSWDGFKITETDWQELNEHNLPTFKGYNSINHPSLPSRIHALGDWLVKVSDQPAAIWWAAKQNKLHPYIQYGIRWNKPQKSTSNSNFIRRAWDYLFEIWENKPRDSTREWYELRHSLDNTGWNEWAIRRYADIHKPYLTLAGRPLTPVPPDAQNFRFYDILPLKVKYSNLPPHEQLIIPDKFLSQLCCALRKNLEHAIHLETELDRYVWEFLPPIIPDNRPSDGYSHRQDGLSGNFLFFASLFEKMVSYDHNAARREFNRWDINDDIIFGRLRIWAAGFESLFSAQEAGKIFLDVSDNIFWLSQHQRDLLLVLVKRWNLLPQDLRKSIEQRLLDGRKKWHEQEENFEEHKAWEILNRLTWLLNNSCQFSFDINSVIKELQQKAPHWKIEYAEKATESYEAGGGIVNIDTNHEVLLTTPADDIIAKAREIYNDKDNFLIQKNSFLGLCIKRPVKALTALRRFTSQKKEFPKWEWGTFLSLEARENDKIKLTELIGRRLLTYSPDDLANIAYEISFWLSNTCKNLQIYYPKLLEDLFIKFIDMIKNNPSLNKSVIIKNSDVPDYLMEAHNSPVGHISEALIKVSEAEDGKFTSRWLEYITILLAADSVTRKFALSCFSRQLNWLYFYLPDWSEINIIAALCDSSTDEYAAAWGGLLSSGRISNSKLLVRLIPNLLTMAINNEKEYHAEILAAILLSAWSSINGDINDYYISDSDLKYVLLQSTESFRSYLLMQFVYWIGEKKAGDVPLWYRRIPYFFDKIWPKQKAIKSPKISSNMCDIAFADEERFPEIVSSILPHLIIVDKSYWLPYHKILSKEKCVIDKHPKYALTIFWTILPDKARDWPYGINEILKRIEQADATLRDDDRLIELKRRWNTL